jgi:hypothetical protein
VSNLLGAGKVFLHKYTQAFKLNVMGQNVPPPPLHPQK